MNDNDYRPNRLASAPSMTRRLRLAAAIAALVLAAGGTHADILTAIGHNTGDAETPGFTFANVPPPSRNDAATTAKFTVIAGTEDANSGGLDKLHDGKLPAESDDPADNFFFDAGTSGGRLAVDLGRAVDIKQVNTYSWHPSSRGPQVYALYAGDETAAGFNASPGADTAPESCGWKLIAKVDTRSKTTDNGGQYGVSIADSTGTIGKYRHLLFAIAPTETDDNFGNTFYSELDVVAVNAPVMPIGSATVPPLVVHSADGYAEISIDTSGAPELKDWAAQTLAPALAEWYPKIVAMMPSDGFAAPARFSVTLRPGDGVAYTTGTRIVVNSTWLDTEIGREAVGSIIHETVHVVQQYGGGWREDQPAPGWLIEGIPDYIRFFKFEPQSHGADLVWLQSRRRAHLNYDGMYRISANFLDYVITHYDPDQTLLKKVNAACRQGSYTDGLWRTLTGKTLPELNTEWKAEVQAHLKNQTGSVTVPNHNVETAALYK